VIGKSARNGMLSLCSSALAYIPVIMQCFRVDGASRGQKRCAFQDYESNEV
jgi:hypothetical protein